MHPHMINQAVRAYRTNPCQPYRWTCCLNTRQPMDGEQKASFAQQMLDIGHLASGDAARLEIEFNSAEVTLLITPIETDAMSERANSFATANSSGLRGIMARTLFLVYGHWIWPRRELAALFHAWWIAQEKQQARAMIVGRLEAAITQASSVCTGIKIH